MTTTTDRGSHLNTTEDVIRLLRAQAWARAKGELESVRVTFFGTASSAPDQFAEFCEAADNFILDVENRGLAE